MITVVKCQICQQDPTHYVNVIYSTFGQTDYGDDYVCEKHIGDYINAYVVLDSTEQPANHILEVEVKSLKGLS